MKRTALVSVLAIAAVALAWLLLRAGDPGQGIVIGSMGAERPGLAPPAARRGPGDVGPGAVGRPPDRWGAESGTGAGPSGTGEPREGDVSTTADAAARAPTAEPAGSTDGFAGARGPSDPSVEMGLTDPEAPGNGMTPGPEREAAAAGGFAPRDAAPDDGDATTPETAPTPEQIAEKVDEALEDVSPEERAAIEEVLAKDIAAKTRQAADWVGAIPPSDPTAAPAP
jgi:hypothetical protein